MPVGLYAESPVVPRMFTHFPTSRPEPSRLRSCTVPYAEAGTALAESFWSVSDSIPVACTGLT